VIVDVDAFATKTPAGVPQTGGAPDESRDAESGLLIVGALAVLTGAGICAGAVAKRRRA